MVGDSGIVATSVLACHHHAITRGAARYLQVSAKLISLPGTGRIGQFSQQFVVVDTYGDPRSMRCHHDRKGWCLPDTCFHNCVCPHVPGFFTQHGHGPACTSEPTRIDFDATENLEVAFCRQAIESDQCPGIERCGAWAAWGTVLPGISVGCRAMVEQHGLAACHAARESNSSPQGKAEEDV